MFSQYTVYKKHSAAAFTNNNNNNGNNRSHMSNINQLKYS